MAGFFSGSETGLVAVNRIKAMVLEEKGGKSAKILSKILKNPNDFLATTLIGTNICVVSATIILTSVLKRYYDNAAAVLISTAVLTPVILIFSEVVPKSVFLANATNLSLKTAYPIKFFMMLFRPVIWLISIFSRFIMYIFRIGHSDKIFNVNKDVIQQVFKWSAKEGVLKEEELEFVESILSIHKVTAREIMVPLIDVVSIEISKSLSDLVELMDKSKISRIAVYEERVDNITGYVSCKDLIYSNKGHTIKELMRECVYIPETKPVDLLLVDIQKQKVPIVFVVDEYGGCSGIITNEDIAEVIVGEILDVGESDDDILVNEDGSIVVSGSVDVDDLNKNYSLGIEKKGFETIGGFVTFILGRIPEEGDKFINLSFRYKVIKAGKKSVDKVQIEKKE
jgi:putative hemolysin